MKDQQHAVFLSYASQDAEAAKRICDALRTAGVEVWFDQNELVGGDAWDQKIRRQIRECALLIPVISAATQARTEGYFRLEWRLAEQRTHLMAKGRPFLLPVVIDETKEAAAHVPDAFLEVQWTRLHGGETTAAFPDRVKRLLHEGTISRESVSLPPAPASRELSSSPQKHAAQWLRWGLAFGVMSVLLLALWERNRAVPSPAKTATSASTPLSPARQLVAKAWVQLNKPGLSRVDLEVAEDLAGHAAALDSTDAEVIAIGAQVDTWFVHHGFDVTAERREQARKKVMRALQLAPQNFEARLAQACYLVRENDQISPETAGLAGDLLDALLREIPAEPRTLEALGTLQKRTGRAAAARTTFEQLTHNLAFAAQAWNDLGWLAMDTGDFKKAEFATDRSIALQPSWSNLSLRAWLAISWRGDPELAKATIERIPLAVMQEDFVISTATWVHWYRRDGPAILRLLKGVSRDWLSSTLMNGPMAAYAAFGHQLAGQKEAEQVQWRAALQVVERRLAASPNSPDLLSWQGFILIELGQREEGEKKFRLSTELAGSSPQGYGMAIHEVLLKRWDEAIAALEVGAEQRQFQVMPALLRRDPHCDALRELPRFKALLARLESDPRFATETTLNQQRSTSNAQ